MSEENHALNPYEMLGVSPAAAMAEIMRAYSQALARKAHPPHDLARALSTLRGKLTRAETDLFTPPDLLPLLEETMHDAQKEMAEMILRSPAALQPSDLVVLPAVAISSDAITPCPLEIMLPKTSIDQRDLMPAPHIDIWETMTDE
jgi:hypothetical protein